MDVKELVPVLVHWIDSMQQEGWGRYDEGASLACTTIGHLYSETDAVVVVALSRSTETMYGSYITIPRAAVQSIVRLVPAPKRCVRKTRPTGR